MKLMEIEIEDSFCAQKQVQSLNIIFQIIDYQKKKLQKFSYINTKKLEKIRKKLKK
mgnify:CR=1 FL=1